jgi:UDP-glucose 4-epimerase
LDVCDGEAWRGLDGVDVVVHLAAVTDENDPHMYTTNVTGTKNAIGYCLRNHALLIFASTNVYGIPTYTPVDESHPVHPANRYAASKAAAEQILSDASQQGLSSVILRLANVYGPGQGVRFVVPSILAQLSAVRAGLSSSIALGDGESHRDFIHVDDVALAILAAANYAGRGCAILNIGTGKSTSIKEVVTIIEHFAGVVPVTYTATSADPLGHIAFDYRKAEQILNWRPQRTLDKGLRELLDDADLLK